MFCLSESKQLNFFDQISELNNLSFQKPVKFLKLLKDNFDINTFIPTSFINNYYSNIGCSRNFNLSSVLASLLIMHFFNIPTVSLLCIFLSLSSEIRDFCQFGRFKISFEKDIANLFDAMVPYIIDICSQI